MWQWLLPVLAGVGGSLFGAKASQGPSSKELGQMTADDFRNLLSIPEVRDFLALQQAQALRMDPLQQAVAQGAFQLLPRHMRQGIDFWQVKTPSLSSFPVASPAPGSALPGNQLATQQPSGYNPSPAPAPGAAVPRRRFPSR